MLKMIKCMLYTCYSNFKDNFLKTTRYKENKGGKEPKVNCKSLAWETSWAVVPCNASDDNQ